MRLARRSTKVLGSSGEDTPGRSAGQVARLAGRVNQSARRSTLRRLEGNDKSRWPGMMVHSGFLRIAGDRQQVGGCNRRRGASPDLQDFEIDLPSWRGREWEEPPQGGAAVKASTSRGIGAWRAAPRWYSVLVRTTPGMGRGVGVQCGPYIESDAADSDLIFIYHPPAVKVISWHTEKINDCIASVLVE